MKKPAKSNMYMDAKLETLAEYDGAIDGDVDADACIIAFGEVPEDVRMALFAACGKIGMAEPVVVDAAQIGEPSRLVFVVEALDPAAIVIADEIALEMANAGYHAKIAPHAPARLLGRPVAAFSSFQADLADGKLKQRDWALLKTLKRS